MMLGRTVDWLVGWLVPLVRPSVSPWCRNPGNIFGCSYRPDPDPVASNSIDRNGARVGESSPLRFARRSAAATAWLRRRNCGTDREEGRERDIRRGIRR